MDSQDFFKKRSEEFQSTQSIQELKGRRDDAQVQLRRQKRTQLLKQRRAIQIYTPSYPKSASQNIGNIHSAYLNLPSQESLKGLRNIVVNDDAPYQTRKALKFLARLLPRFKSKLGLTLLSMNFLPILKSMMTSSKQIQKRDLACICLVNLCFSSLQDLPDLEELANLFMETLDTPQLASNGLMGLGNLGNREDMLDYIISEPLLQRVAILASNEECAEGVSHFLFAFTRRIIERKSQFIRYIVQIASILSESANLLILQDVVNVFRKLSIVDTKSDIKLLFESPLLSLAYKSLESDNSETLTNALGAISNMLTNEAEEYKIYVDNNLLNRLSQLFDHSSIDVNKNVYILLENAVLSDRCEDIYNQKVVQQAIESLWGYKIDLLTESCDFIKSLVEKAPLQTRIDMIRKGLIGGIQDVFLRVKDNNELIKILLTISLELLVTGISVYQIRGLDNLVLSEMKNTGCIDSIKALINSNNNEIGNMSLEMANLFFDDIEEVLCDTPGEEFII